MDDKVLRNQLLTLLDGGQAHLGFDNIVDDFPLDKINSKPAEIPYSPWQLLEHIRIAQKDILEFIRDPAYESPEWPKGYWPPSAQQADENQWHQTIKAIRKDRSDLQALVRDPKNDLTRSMPQGEKYTLLRQVLLVADHTAYHLGALAMIKRLVTSS
ncbi:DinB family protein [candidate division KSB1 bacterium]|jgi:hypothetical protein|nr:DinB family protein [candidate division KSB1 bacterium]